jgi:general secretion pathway protein A
MYEEFFGFKEKPFQIAPNPAYFYKSPKHQNALTYLEYGISENVGFMLLTGEIGSGKTTLIQYILNHLEDDTEATVVFNTNVSADQLLPMILSKLELSSQTQNKAAALDLLYQFLMEKFAQKKRVLLIFDEAQSLSPQALEEVRMLSNLQNESEGLLQIMLVGQPELMVKLQKPGMVQLSQRIAVNFHLEGLNRDETGLYITHRLETAGGRGDLFTETAVDMIFEATGGIPRSINLVCQAALVYAFADGVDRVDEHIIDQIKEDKIGIGLACESVENQGETAAGPTEMADAAILQRLQTLENTLQSFHVQTETRIHALEQRAQGFNREVLDRLNELLEKERKHHANLLRRYTALEMKYEALKRNRTQSEEGINHSPEETEENF